MRNGHGKRVIKETADKIAEVEESRGLFGFFKKRLPKRVKKTVEVDLITRDYVKIVKEHFFNRLKTMLFIVLALVIIFAAAYIGLKFYKLSLVGQYNEVLQTISQTEAEVASFNAEQYQAARLTDRAAALQSLLAGHVYWTQLFNALEHNTAPNVYYRRFAADAEGNVQLSASADTYSDVAKQLLILQNADFAQNVEINAADLVLESVRALESALPGKTPPAELTAPAAGKTSVEFNVTLKLADDALVR